MKRKILKVIVCMLMSILIISTILNIFSLAGDEDNRFDFENIANTAGSNKLNSPVRKIAMTIILTVKIASISIAVFILIVISMRYMISAPRSLMYSSLLMIPRRSPPQKFHSAMESSSFLI